jgi:hypothetical protein
MVFTKCKIEVYVVPAAPQKNLSKMRGFFMPFSSFRTNIYVYFNRFFKGIHIPLNQILQITRAFFPITKKGRIITCNRWKHPLTGIHCTKVIIKCGMLF